MTQGADEFMHCVAVLTVLRVSQASYLAKSGRQRVGLAANIKPCITEVRGASPHPEGIWRQKLNSATVPADNVL